jgi:signal transduction histidine kinase
MNLKQILIIALFVVCLSFGADKAYAAQVDKFSKEYLELRDSTYNAFNEGDSARFFAAIKRFEEYLLANDDLHAYYTQRCNEIVFMLNRESVFEAYKYSMALSKELRERGLESELYMAYNMMGHVNKYCGNKDIARKCFYEVLRRMEKEGYYESMPPIYMNLANLDIDDHPAEALKLLDRAAQVADSVGRSRIDIDAYRAVYAFKQGDMDTFLDGYRRYQDSVALGQTSVHGGQLEAFYLLHNGDANGAIHRVRERYGNSESYGVLAYIYEYIGDWQHAYEEKTKEMQVSDSIVSVILSNSMHGIENDLQVYEAERRAAHQQIIALIAIAVGLLIIVGALVVLSFFRRRHFAELKVARDRALESDRMKSAFIRNISHEIRTPLNIISGFTQVIASNREPIDSEEYHEIMKTMMRNTDMITSLVDELLDLSIIDSSSNLGCDDMVRINDLCSEVVEANRRHAKSGVVLQVSSVFDDDYQLKTNRAVLRKILQALVDNAVKNTETGSVVVRVRKLPAAIAFDVEDTGCGIPLSDAERIFDRFEKLDDFKAGLGLGLPLARSLAQRLGGTLTLDTTYIGGARFVVELPLA